MTIQVNTLAARHIGTRIAEVFKHANKSRNSAYIWAFMLAVIAYNVVTVLPDNDTGYFRARVVLSIIIVTFIADRICKTPLDTIDHNVLLKQQVPRKTAITNIMTCTIAAWLGYIVGTVSWLIHPVILSVVTGVTIIICVIAININSIKRDARRQSRTDTLTDYELTEHLRSIR